MLNAKLIIVGGKAKTKEVHLQLPTTIGRGKESDLTIPHALVSRSHTLLFERDGQLCAKDLGSLNGTFIDNQRIRTEQIISPNQLLTLGDITFRAVYDIDQSAKQTLPGNDSNSFQTLTINPINLKTPDKSKPTVDAPADASLAIDVEDSITPPRSAISEIDSFDPDEIGSLDNSGKFEPTAHSPDQSIRSTPTIVTPAGPTLPNQLEPNNKTLAPKPPAPSVNPNTQPDATADEPIDLQLTDPAPLAQLSSVDVDLDLPEDRSAPPVSFVGSILTDDDPNSPSAVDDFQINLGSDIRSEASIDESQLGSFLKNLPK